MDGSVEKDPNPEYVVAGLAVWTDLTTDYRPQEAREVQNS
jgi:hypothetical protein